MLAASSRERVYNWVDAESLKNKESLLAEDKKAYKWWYEDLKTTEPTMNRTDWTRVRKEFKKRWPPLPELEEDLEAKQEELERMRLEDRDLGAKVTYQGQELYSHVTFANQAAHLANEIGDTNAFLLPSVRNHLPEAARNTLKSTGKKPKTWEEFRKAMTMMPLSDLWEEATEIAKCDSFYMEVTELCARTSGLTPTMTQMTLLPRPAPAPALPPPPAPQAALPAMLPPRYLNPVPMPCTPTQNRPPFNGNPQNSLTNLFQATPNTNWAPFGSPTTGAGATPTGRAKEMTGGPFENWDRRAPYPKTTEGKAAYETAMQAWWERNGFNSRATMADLILLSPGTAQTGTWDCYSCGWNDRGDSHFPHSSDNCMIMPKIPQEKSWHAFCGNQARGTTAAEQQNQATIQQIGGYETYQEQTRLMDPNQGNGEEPTA